MPDITNLPDNSFSAREAKPKAEQPEKKFDKVTTGEVRTKKKSEVKKIFRSLVPEDITSFRAEARQDVLIPAIKRVLFEIFSLFFLGDRGAAESRRNRSRSSVSYRDYYQDPRDDRRDRGRPRMVGMYEYDDVIFPTRGDAEIVLEELEAAIEMYGQVSVADLYDLAGVTCNTYTANRYGWEDLRNARVVSTRDGYIIQLPRTVQIS